MESKLNNFAIRYVICIHIYMCVCSCKLESENIFYFVVDEGTQRMKRESAIERGRKSTCMGERRTRWGAHVGEGEHVQSRTIMVGESLHVPCFSNKTCSPSPPASPIQAFYCSTACFMQLCPERAREREREEDWYQHTVSRSWWASSSCRTLLIGLYTENSWGGERERDGNWDLKKLARHWRAWLGHLYAMMGGGEKRGRKEGSMGSLLVGGRKKWTTSNQNNGAQILLFLCLSILPALLPSSFPSLHHHRRCSK